MSAEFDATMKNVCHSSLHKAYEKAQNEDLMNVAVQSLNENQIQQLIQKIDALPVDYKNILFSHYCFALTPADTEEMLETDNAKGKLRYVRRMMSCFMGLGSALIDDESMKTACEVALSDYVATDNIDTLPVPAYSNKFRRKLKQIKSAQKPSNIVFLIMKRVAVFIIICGISFSTVLVVNADAREQFFNWVVKTFPQFSIFISQKQENQLSNLESFEIGYIPDGFMPAETNHGKSMIIREYRNLQNQRITITISNGGRFYKDTEEMKISEFDFKDGTAFWWTDDSLTHFVWRQDGVTCNITAECSIDEVIKTAENIKNN